MNPTRLLVGIAAVAGSVLLAVPAYAATGQVDGNITVGDSSCSWTNATTSDVPANTLTIDHTTVHPTCTGSITAGLTNDPTVTFDDTAGTASAPEVDVNGSELGQTCSYKATDVTYTRQGTTRNYTGGPFTANLTDGSFLCPKTETVSAASLAFH
ncbi:hypothetical protein [Kutzneria sp. 744]|uniref:hypothetical protein n=1 Tax=Kutzneria sp. (strain 744) TaxID=345341 RepID=UPI0003EEABF8|nr:hypothetical protein [Kutzneria sp. 744]EWM18673.1 hypothetical protein KUTG_08977 [Kutzneria sp. 744]